MASDKDKDDEETKTAEPVDGGDPSLAAADPSMTSNPSTAMVVEGDAGVDAEVSATTMGSQRYVHAAFLAIGILIAFLGGKIVTLLWNNLADWPAAVRTVPQLVAYSEESRESISLTVGALAGALIAFRMYRKESLRRFANEVAAELIKVTWPNREAVVNGTIVVMIASAIATVYVAVLDRFWSFLTTLVYGA